MSKKSKFVQVSIEKSIHERLVVLREVSGLSMYRILAFAMLDWEHKHAKPDSAAGRALAEIDKKEKV